MFDLFRSRAKAVRYLLGGLLTVVALSMVITLIPGFGSGSAADDNVVAVVGKDAITVREVQNELQALTRNRQIPPEMLQVYAPQYIDQMILERSVAYQAKRMGFDVSDQELATAIRGIVPSFFNNGQLVDKAAYESFLADRGLTIPQFEDNVRKQILLSRLQNIALDGVIVTPQELKSQFEKTHAKVKIDYLAYDPENLKSAVNITPQDLQMYYQANQNNYMVPEQRNLALLVANQDKIAATINVPEDRISQYYNSNRDQFRTPERVKARHILIKTTGKSAAEIEKLKQKAEDLLKQVKNGGNFAELAKKNSEDTTSAINGGELGWLVRGQTVKNFENAAFSLRPGQISDLITTEYGFHIIQLEEKQDAHTQALEEVKDKIAADLKRQVLFDRMQNAVDQARLALQKSPGNIDQIANQYNLEVIHAEKIGAGQALPQLGAVPDLDAALAGLKKGDVTPVFQAPGDKLVVGEVTDVFPSHVQPLSEVEARVRDTVAGQKAQTLAMERATDAAKKLRAGESLQQVAKETGVEVKNSEEFTINDAIQGIGSGSAFSEAFTSPVGAVVGPVPATNKVVVAKIAAKIPANMSEFESAKSGIMQDLKQRKQQERRDLFFDSILAQLIREGKVKKHQDTIRRLVTAYRG